MIRLPFLFVPGLAALLLAPPAGAESLYKCTGEKGAVSIQSEPCPKGMTQVWKRDTAPDPEPTPEARAAQAAAAEAEAARAAEAARLANLERLAEQLAREEQARAAAAAAPAERPATKSECTLAHDFQDATRDMDWLELTQSQRERIRSWVIRTCRDPDAPVAPVTETTGT
ncbi:MAG TPA: DUF4124 domain-containing protein [Arenimonas sp.]|uniref:DUF4124 domain-containing protein n=1 Tax=Arenimonas sp. TaxID=1872635 RepID=UPI002D7E2AD9|nr:DUF4124 domain-containing protein [Arenimonas sp.]HEU0152482.1 DUF4124 domain-containing protein [Arenimonas sp.]